MADRTTPSPLDGSDAASAVSIVEENETEEQPFPWNRLEALEEGPKIGRALWYLVYSCLCFLFIYFVYVWIRDRAHIQTIPLLGWIIIATSTVFCCSAAELSISGTSSRSFNEFEERRTNSNTIPERFALFSTIRYHTIHFLLWERKGVRKHDAWANSVIVLFNTTAVVLFSIKTSKFAPDESIWFTAAGVTIIMALVGEVLPKQRAVKDPTRWLFRTWWWVVVLFFVLPLPIIALGLISSPRVDGQEKKPAGPNLPSVENGDQTTDDFSKVQPEDEALGRQDEYP